MSQSSAAPRRPVGSDPLRHGDETAPPGGGIFRKISPVAGGSGLAGAFSVIEGLFAPAAKQAREELERQKTIGARNPSDTDPPDDHDVPPAPRVAAPGRPGTPYSGTVLIRPPARPR